MFMPVSGKGINDLKQNASPSKEKEATKRCVVLLQVKFVKKFPSFMKNGFNKKVWE